MKLRRANLQTYLLILSTLCVLPVVLGGAWVVALTYDRHQRDVERTTLELSRALGSAVEAELEGTTTALLTLASTPLLEQAELERFHALARDVVARRPDWQSILLLDDAGRVLLRTSVPFGANPGLPADPGSLARALADGQPSVGGIARGPQGTGGFAVRVPVVQQGRLRYVLTAVIKPDRIFQLVQKQQIPESWNAAVFDRNMLRIARSKDQSNTFGRPAGPSLTGLVRSHSRQGVGITRTNEGHEVRTGFTRLPHSGWTVAVGAPVAEEKVALARQLGWLGGGTALSLLLCLVLASRISRRITADIRVARDQAVQLGNGQPFAPAAASPITELQEMHTALEAASARLSEASTAMRLALQRAEEGVRVKDEFLAMLGHELRNPLAPMVSALHLMDLKSGGSLGNERRILRRQVDHMRALVDDLLDVSRIASGKFTLQKRPVDLAVVIERAVETVQPSLKERGRAVALQLPGQPMWVEGDENRLVQVVTNLLTNALKFDQAADIALTAQVDPDGAAHISVRDRGLGMTRETLQRVFEPFYQAAQTLERSSGGLGLGLAIAHSIVRLHGGSLTATSDGPGEGSTFTLTLPMVTPAAAASTQAQRRSGRARVLLVDDNIDALTVLAEVLHIAGHEVRTAAHPHEALELVGTFLPEVAVLDIGLPDMDGYELATRARELNPAWEGRLVALTGYGQQHDRQKALAAGFIQHLTKPVEPSVLLDVIGQAVQAEALAAGQEAGAPPVRQP